MTLQQLIYAEKIDDNKSMNKAATELFVSQPALSSTMRDLEEELQIEIFIRAALLFCSRGVHEACKGICAGGFRAGGA